MWFTDAAKIYLDTLNIYPELLYLPNIESSSQCSLPWGCTGVCPGLCPGVLCWEQDCEELQRPFCLSGPPKLGQGILSFFIIHLSPSAASGSPRCACSSALLQGFLCFLPKPSTEDLCSHTNIWSTPKMLLGLSCKSFMKQCPDKSMVESSLLQALGQPSWTGDAQGYQTGKASGHVGCPMPSFAAPQSTGITAKACVALTGSLRII